MAKRNESVSSSVKSVFDPNAPCRRFRSKPLGSFIEKVVAEIRRTGRPEDVEDLYRGKLPRDAKYRILWQISIDGKKRDGDMAPCPMCTPNRFLNGCLAWFYELGVVAVIGHCCAEHADEAEREYKASELLRKQEDFLLEALPHVATKAAIVESLRPAAAEAGRVYRLFRRKGSHIQKHLRDIKGQLRLYEMLDRSEYTDGPAGLRGAPDNIREHSLGRVQGMTALLSDYKPEAELDTLARQIAAVRTAEPGEEVYFVARMSESERKGAVALLQIIDQGYLRFRRRFDDFRSFFDRENIEALRGYGASPHAHFRFTATWETIHGRPRITMQHRGNVFREVLGSAVDDVTTVEWPIASF